MTIETVKTISENDILATVANVRAVNLAAMKAQGNAHNARRAIMQTLIDAAKSAGVSQKQAIEDIDTAVKGFSLAKGEKIVLAARDASGGFLLDENGEFVDPGTEWKLGYSMGRAYVQSAQIAFATGVEFSLTLYHRKSADEAEKRKRDAADKLAAAERVAKEAQEKAQAAAKKAARSKSVEVKLAAEAAQAEAVKAQETVRTLIDTPTTKKTGGRKKKETAPSAPKTLTRHEVAMHATALVAMLRGIGEDTCADDVADILTDHNLLVK